MKYLRVYAALKEYGHHPTKAGMIVLDASRGDRHALDWIKVILRSVKDSRKSQKEEEPHD